MIKLLLYINIFFISFIGCKAQENVTGRYTGLQYSSTKNSSYIRQELIFIKENKDTLKMNVVLPYDTTNYKVVNKGIFYNCHLKENIIYTINIKKICISDIPKEFNSYYKTNTVGDKANCSKLTEFEKNSNYVYLGNYGKYVNIDGLLYEIIGITPDDGCVFQN